MSAHVSIMGDSSPQHYGKHYGISGLAILLSIEMCSCWKTTLPLSRISRYFTVKKGRLGQVPVAFNTLYFIKPKLVAAIEV